MNRLFAVAALHATTVFFAAGVAAAATSTFDAGTEDWSVLGDVAGPVQWVAADGNPGGYISVEDSVTGGVTYFSAPPAFLGDQTAFLGRALVFDLRQHITGAPNQFQDDDVVLIAAASRSCTISWATRRSGSGRPSRSSRALELEGRPQASRRQRNSSRCFPR